MCEMFPKFPKKLSKIFSDFRLPMKKINGLQKFARGKLKLYERLVLWS